MGTAKFEPEKPDRMAKFTPITFPLVLNTGPACLEIMRRPNCFPLVAGSGARQHKPVLVQGDAIAKPPGIRPRSKKKKNVLDGLVFDLLLPRAGLRTTTRSRSRGAAAASVPRLANASAGALLLLVSSDPSLSSSSLVVPVRCWHRTRSRSLCPARSEVPRLRASNDLFSSVELRAVQRLAIKDDSLALEIW